MLVGFTCMSSVTALTQSFIETGQDGAGEEGLFWLEEDDDDDDIDNFEIKLAGVVVEMGD